MQILSRVMPPCCNCQWKKTDLAFAICLICHLPWNPNHPETTQQRRQRIDSMPWVLMIFMSSLKMYFENCYIYEGSARVWANGYCYCYCAFALNYWNIFRALAGWHCFCSFVFEAGSLSAIARQLHLDTPNTTQYTQRINQDFITIHNYDSGLKHFIFYLFFN